ncbi:MAG TPA: metallophosphoesterase [Candidatus Enterenecus stercoripullorum]|nr:metallophosphoesterase [Candidatus Enterenecus stercoripullorum]
MRWVAALLVLLVGGWFFLQWQLWGIQITVTQVPVAGLPEEFEGLRIVQISDLHGHAYGEDSGELLELVAGQEPDLIAVTGDLIDRESQMEMVPALARGLAVIAPTYYVTGNHEWAVGNVPRLKGILAECGVTVFSNQYTILERGGASLVLAGIDDPNGYADQKTPEELYEEIRAQAADQCIILLAHRNDRFDQYAAAGYNLVISGHGHGGIVRLPFTDGLLGTNRRFFPTWTSGVYTLGDSTLFVSRGLGNNTVPIPGFRLFNRPDLAVLELTAGEAGA